MNSSSESFLNRISDLTSNSEGAPLRCFGLAGTDESCGPKCGEFLAGFERRFEAYAQTRKDFALSHIVYRGVAEVELTVYHSALSMLMLPSTLAEYLSAIGDKSRNIIRKAERQGYYYQTSDGAEFRGDIFEIRNSTPVRRGHPIPEYWRRFPGPPLDNRGLCSRHQETFHGVLKDNKLVAYCTLRHYGGIAQVNHILGHHDHLNGGVMYLLIKGMVSDLIERKLPNLRAVNYLYPEPSTSLGLFKAGVGFSPNRTITFTENLRLEQEIEAFFESSSETIIKQETRRATHRPVNLSKDILFGGDRFIATGDSSALHCLLAAATAECDNPRAILFDYRNAKQPEIKACLHEIGIQLVDLEILERDRSTSDVTVDVFVCAPKEEALVESIGKNLALYASYLNIGGHLLLRFVIEPARAVAAQMISSDVGTMLERVYGGRFKSKEPCLADVSMGFRGSAFQAVGMVDEDPTQERSRGIGWLALRRVR